MSVVNQMQAAETCLFIGGQSRPSLNGATFERHSPLNGELVTVASAASTEDARDAVSAAAHAYPDWSQTGPDERRRLLLNAAKELRNLENAFAEAMVAEIGSTREWAEFNISLAEQVLLDAASLTTQVTGQVLPSDRKNTLSMGIRQPAGVCLAIAPWNAPIVLGFRAVSAPLACGNTLVLKASELCPATHSLIGQVFDRAGIPPGVINILTNAPADAEELVHELIAHPAVRRINFTGSTRVGRMVAQDAAKYLKRCLLELGGKSPLLILDDADLDAAAEAAAFGSFLNQGQICMSTERIVVMESVADAFVSKFAEKAGDLKAGDPSKGDFPLGPLISAEAAARLKTLLEDAESKGAQIITGGMPHGGYMDATVVNHVTPAMHIYNEECFGPVATIVHVETVDEAVTIVNDSEYGLAAAVFGQDIHRATSVCKRIESGICHVNSATVADEPHMPFGGMKDSGYGRFGGTAAIDEFTELRWITITGHQ